MDNKSLIIGLVIGLVVGFFVGWTPTRKKKRGAKDAVEDKRKAEMKRIEELLHADPEETVDAHVASSDIERESFVSIEYHLKDILEELQIQKKASHRMRLVVDMKADEAKLATLPEVRQHFLKLQTRVPHLAVFLEPKSMRTYLRVLLAAREEIGVVPNTPGTTPVDLLQQEIVGYATQLVTALVPGQEEAMSDALVSLLERFEEVCEALEAELYPQVAAAQAAAQT